MKMKMNEKLTFCTMAKASCLLSQVPLLNAPHSPSGLPKLANFISEMGRPWQDNSKLLFSRVFPQADPTITVWKFTSDGLPPISSNKTNVLISSWMKERGTWYLD